MGSKYFEKMKWYLTGNSLDSLGESGKGQSQLKQWITEKDERKRTPSSSMPANKVNTTYRDDG